MAEPSFVPGRFPHGTRSRYVNGCRCTRCRAANRAAYHDQQTRVLEAVRDLPPAPPAPAIQELWTAPDGSRRTRTYPNACPGVNGEPCARGRHVRRDSAGGICKDCRKRLVWNGLVDAGPARRHLRKLSRRGVGYRAVADASDVAHATLQKIRRGEKRRIRKSTADAILAVTKDASADHALVPAGRTLRMLRELEAECLTQKELARRLGYRTPKVQLRGPRVRARTEHRVARLYRQLIGEDPPA